MGNRAAASPRRGGRRKARQTKCWCPDAVGPFRALTVVALVAALTVLATAQPASAVDVGAPTWTVDARRGSLAIGPLGHIASYGLCRNPEASVELRNRDSTVAWSATSPNAYCDLSIFDRADN